MSAQAFLDLRLSMLQSEEGLRAGGRRFDRTRGAEQEFSFDTKSGVWVNFNSMRRVGETHAAYKIRVEQSSDRLLGAHLLGPDAAELINVFALAMKFQRKTTDVKSVLLAFATFTSDTRSML